MSVGTRVRARLARTSVKWRLVAFVTAVLVAASAVVFGVVYEQTGHQLQSQVDHDVTQDLSQLSQAVRTMPARSPEALLSEIDSYLRAQPFNATSTLMFASIPGHGAVSSPPELVGRSVPDSGEDASEQSHENALARAVLTGPLGLSTRSVPDLGHVRFRQQIIQVGGMSVRLGAGEPLIIVVRAKRGIAKSFLIGGAVALVLALIAAYLAGASLSLPLRRMARVAARVDDGDMEPRMHPSSLAGSEVQVLAESFNHMLDRLSEAFAAQRDFIADASHELRTPLTVIAGQMEVLAAQDNPSSEEVRRVERLVAGEIARTSRLVDDMLLLVRSERGDFLRCQPIELEPFISELWWGACISDERQFELGPIPDAKLTADPDRLAQALRNLIRNAVEHTTEPNGLVRLEVEPRPEGRVAFIVLDDGPGIPPNQLERVFERFHRTDHDRSRQSGGAGLGLSIVLAIAQAHGGTARALATATGGARIELELPGLHDVRPAPAGGSGAVPDEGPRRRAGAGPGVRAGR